MVIFQFLPRKFAIRTWFCNCPQYFGLLHIDVECIPSIHDPGKMLVLPNQLLYWVLSTSDLCFASFQPILCHPHTQMRIILFHDERRDIHNLEISPSHVSIRCSQIAFPIIVLPKDDHTDFAQEERLGLPHWLTILAICIVENESKCLDIPILFLFCVQKNGTSSIFTWYKQILHQLLVHTLTVWIWSPWLWPLSFVTLMILVQWVLHKNQNRLLQHHLGIQLDLSIFGANICQMTCLSENQNEVLRPSSLLHQSPLFYFWLSSSSTLESFQVFPILYPLLPFAADRVSVFQLPTFAPPSAWHFFPFCPRILAKNDLAWMSAAFSLISPRTTCIRLEIFLQIKWLGETCPIIRQISWPIDVPIVVDAAFLFFIQIRH